MSSFREVVALPKLRDHTHHFIPEYSGRFRQFIYIYAGECFLSQNDTKQPKQAEIG